MPELAHKPIVIGENDPEGCAACPGPQNAYRNGALYSSYTAASYARLWELARRRDVDLEGALTWAFTFVGQPWFAGYRQLATNGVDLPVLNVFRLFSRLGYRAGRGKQQRSSYPGQDSVGRRQRLTRYRCARDALGERPRGYSALALPGR